MNREDISRYVKGAALIINSICPIISNKDLLIIGCDQIEKPEELQLIRDILTFDEGIKLCLLGNVKLKNYLEKHGLGHRIFVYSLSNDEELYAMYVDLYIWFHNKNVEAILYACHKMFYNEHPLLKNGTTSERLAKAMSSRVYIEWLECKFGGKINSPIDILKLSYGNVLSDNEIDIIFGDKRENIWRILEYALKNKTFLYSIFNLKRQYEMDCLAKSGKIDTAINKKNTLKTFLDVIGV